MAALSARTIHLTDQILAALAAEGTLPISTMALWEKVRTGPASNGGALRPASCSDVLRILNRLARRGDVEKLKLDDMRSRYWRVTGGTS